MTQAYSNRGRWSGFWEAFRTTLDPTPPAIHQHRPSVDDVRSAIESIYEAGLMDRSGRTVHTSLTRSPAPPEMATTREIVLRWLRLLPQACTPASIRVGEVRLRDDVPKHVVENFLDLSRRLDKDLLRELQRQSAEVYNDYQGDVIDDIAAAIDLVATVQLNGYAYMP